MERIRPSIIISESLIDDMRTEKYHVDTWTLDLLRQTAQYFHDHQQQAYLVGGSVRNLLLNEPCTDWDIVTDGTASQSARQLANTLGGHYAHLHNKASRVVVKHDQQAMILDISPLKGDSITADLHGRDFTVNAIAAPLNGVIEHLTSNSPLPLIDPLHGETDLSARLLKAVGESIFRDDPLRMLRAVRFMMRYQLSIDPLTAQLLSRDAPLIVQAAPERIHEELYAILQPDGATDRLRFLDQHGLFMALFPEFLPARGMLQPGLHYWDVLEHSLETVGTLEQLANVFQQAPELLWESALDLGKRGDLAEIQALLQEAEQQGIFTFATLAVPPMKLAALLHDIGKTVTHSVDSEGKIHFYRHPQEGVPLAQHMMKRLSASTEERRLVQQVVAHHMRPGQLSHDVITIRATRRFFVDLGTTGINVLLVALADHLAMRGPAPLTEAWMHHLATTRILLLRYIRQRDSILPPRLIQPEELIRRLHLERGPIIGTLLEQIAEAQADGLISSKDEALWFAEEKLGTTAIQSEKAQERDSLS